MRKRGLSLLCAAAMALGLLTLSVPAAETGLSAKGWFETICAQLIGVSDADVTAVRYTDADGVETALAGDDFRYLVRNADGGVRIDIPGVRAGTYSLSVEAAGQTYTAHDIQVMAYDRSGYAHWNYTEGVGAYNDDGTLKANARVLYVTEENKETVTLSARNGSKTITVTGIGNILNRLKGSVGNNAILRYLALNDRTPLVVRIVGRVTAPTGLTPWVDSTDPGRENGNNGSMAMLRDTANVTIEGIGDDATLDGWGVSFSVSSGVTADGVLGKNFEVRNLTFRNVPEDCVEITGREGEDGQVDWVRHTWVHNCAFYVPYIENAAAVDKHDGDGAVDYKVGQYMTLSYNYFENYHKTSILGADGGQEQYHITWHHNHWNGCDQRCPLGRHSNVHIYNNLYENTKEHSSSYCMCLLNGCYVFSEYNHFINCTHPVRLSTGSPVEDEIYYEGTCKSWQDVFTACKGVNQAVRVAAKGEKVPNANKYPDFDTDPAISYIPAGDYALDESIEEARANIDAYTGPMKPLEDIVTPGHRHRWSPWQVTKPANCTGEGVWTRTCAADGCPVGSETKTVPAVGHAYEESICRRCGDDLRGRTYTLTAAELYQNQATRPTPGMTLGGDSQYPDSYYASQAVGDVGGTEDFFTVLYSVGTRLEPKNKTFDDGYRATHRLNFTYSARNSANAIQFTLPGPATVKVWWVGTLSEEQLESQPPRPMVILNVRREEVAVSETVGNNITPMISAFTLNEPGIYYLGGKGGKNYIYKVEVTMSGTPEPAQSGVLSGEDGRTLGWRYRDGRLFLTDAPGPEERALAGCYDDERRFLEAKVLTDTRRSVPLAADISTVKLFWLTGENAPLSLPGILWEGR